METKLEYKFLLLLLFFYLEIVGTKVGWKFFFYYYYLFILEG